MPRPPPPPEGWEPIDPAPEKLRRTHHTYGFADGPFDVPCDTVERAMATLHYTDAHVFVRRLLNFPGLRSGGGTEKHRAEVAASWAAVQQLAATAMEHKALLVAENAAVLHFLPLANLKGFARQLRDESKRDQHRVKARKKNGLDDAEAFCGSLRAWAAPVLTDHAAGSTRASGKAQVCLALLAEVKRRGERCVVFTQTLGTLDVLEDLLASTDIAWCRIDGSTPAAARSEIVHAFNARKEQGKRVKRDAVDALLVSIRAGGEGVNMTGACRVVLYDVCWNPCFDRQAMCRAHRLGQKREVNVYRLVAPAGTMEARVFQLQRRKELLVREVIQQRGVSVEAARLVAGAGDEILKTVVAAHAAAVVGVREDPLETAPPVPLQKLLTEPEKRRAVDEWAAARASN